MDLEGRTIALTGATGFLGSHTALELLRRGAKVRGVVRSPEKGRWLAEQGVELVSADLMDRDALEAAFAGADAIVSNAALFVMERRSWKEFYDVNRTGTANVFHGACRAGVKRIVQVSTVGVYKVRLCRTVDEDAPQLTEKHRYMTWAYAVTKALSEQLAWELAEQEHLDLTVIRPGPIYGSRDRNAIPTYRRFMRWPVAPAPTFGLPHVHAGDVAIAIAGALENEDSVGRAYNVAGEAHTIRDFMRAWKKVTGEGPLLVPLPVPAFVGYDTSDARRDLGFRNRPLEEGLREALLTE